MSSKIFIDTSAWIAYSLRGEKQHEIVKKIIKDYILNGEIISTSTDVIGETVTRLIYDTTWQITKQFIRFIDKTTTRRELVRFLTDELIQKEAFDVVEKFAEHKLSYIDATTVVLMRRFNIAKIVTLDSDFKKIGIPAVP